MADKRPWAKIDTGYMLNPKWFKVERLLREAMPNAMPLVIANAIRTARESHLASVLYCAQNATDGVFPVRAIKALAMVQDDTEEAAITALFEVGLWINKPGGMAEVRDFLEHQTPSSSLKELTQKRSEAGKAGAAARWQTDSKSHGKSMANATVDKKRREEKEKSEPEPRPDVLELIDYHNARLQELGVRPQSKSKKNLDAMRLLMDKDGKTPEQIKLAIDFSLKDKFWSQNIHCADTLRDKYDRLSIKARNEADERSEPDRLRYRMVSELPA